MTHKFIMSIVFVLSLIGHSHVLNAQCDKCISTTQYDLKEIVICHKDEKFTYSRSASLFRNVSFTTWGFIFSSDIDKVYFVDFADGVGFRQSNGGQTFQINYTTAGQKNIRIRKGTNGKIVNEFTVLVKTPAKGYESPDVVWKVETPQVFNPSSHNLGATASAFPANGAAFMAATKGVGHAYIKYANSDKKLRKPIIFVDGIDFNSEDKNYYDPALGSGKTDANVIRHGSTGWDIFSMGADDGWSKATPDAEEDFRMYPEVFQNLSDKGYDIVFLDFVEGATWIQKNAQVLIHFL
jgi:hypothetical protein